MYLGELCDLFANCKQSGIYFCCGGFILLVNWVLPHPPSAAQEFQLMF